MTIAELDARAEEFEREERSWQIALLGGAENPVAARNKIREGFGR